MLTADKERIDGLQRRCDDLAAQVAQLQDRPQRVEQATLDPDHVTALVAAALRKKGVAVDPQELVEAVEEAAPQTAADWFERLKELREAGEDAADVWSEIEAQDRLDEVLDLYRAAIEGAPNSVDAHHDLARAAHAAAMSRPNHKDGRFWTESDDAYGKVLEIDPGHWDARYEKAVRLTFWPEAYGRMPEAMGHFEKLIEQHESIPAEPRQARVYYWLGNLLAQQGDEEKAAKIWQRGLGRHPGNESLQDRLDALRR